MAAEKKPSGKTHGARKMSHMEDRPSLGWHEFFLSLATERSPDCRPALAHGIQECHPPRGR